MSSQRTHYLTTTDGVTIGGTVHGQGPPLVFSPGGIGDGDLDWQALLPHLTAGLRAICRAGAAVAQATITPRPQLQSARR